MNDVNEFEFIGTIVNKNETEKADYFTIGTFRSMSGKRRVSDYPRIVCYDEEVRAALKKVELHDKIRIKGYVSSISPRKAAENKGQKNYNPPQIFVAESITPAPSMIDEVLNVSTGNNTPASDKNEIKLIGTVNRSYYGKGGNINLVLAVTREDGKYLKFVHVTRFPAADENVAEYAKPNTKVGIVGSVRTARKEAPNGKTVNFESIVADAVTAVK